MLRLDSPLVIIIWKQFTIDAHNASAVQGKGKTMKNQKGSEICKKIYKTRQFFIIISPDSKWSPNEYKESREIFGKDCKNRKNEEVYSSFPFLLLHLF